jgi:RimJ/RimL family protein N-acetyltransferase
LSGWSHAWGEVLRRVKGVVDGITHLHHKPPAESAGGLRAVADAIEDGNQAGRAEAAAHEFASPHQRDDEPAEYGERLDPPALSRGSDTTEVRRITPDDWRSQRDLALQTLEESPQSFKTTYEQAAARTEQQWRDRIAADPSTFVTFRDGKPVGNISAVPDADRPGVMEIVGVWVAPTARGTGASDLLMQNQLQWLRDNNYREAVLWHLEGNTAMERLARRHGFTHTGRRQTDAGYPEPIVEMSRDLG